MDLVRRRAYARAGLIGNPSDGYRGRTISFTFRELHAEVTLYDWPEIEILPGTRDAARWASLADLAVDARRHGLYGGLRLLKALLVRFEHHFRERGVTLPRRNFSMRYASTIPPQVGLAGSSAILVAALRALLDWYEVAIAPEVQPSFVLAIENEDLGIAAGLQDRVAQVYDGLVAMDFAEEKRRVVDGYDVYEYLPLAPELLRNAYVAWRTDLAEPSEVLHNDLRLRFRRGDPEVVAAMRRFADLATGARAALESGDSAELARLINANFDLRRSVCRLPSDQVLQVETARAAGASAKFAGSGGAIIGTYADDEVHRELERRLAAIGTRVVRPTVVEPCGNQQTRAAAGASPSVPRSQKSPRRR